MKVKATLIRNGMVFAPQKLGVQDILIVGNIIVQIGHELAVPRSLPDLEIIDAKGKVIVPAFIDQHVHLIGGGGESGFNSRTPEIQLSTLIRTGITTVVGLLGTDGFTRHMETLYAKTKALEAEGITAFLHTGSYTIPSVTITGSVVKDIMFIDNVIGVKVALSDHRSSHCSAEELTRLASEARVAGMLSGKPGMVHIHMGRGKARMDMLFDVVERSDIPIKQFMPTHVTRTKELFGQAMEFAKLGGRIDITAIAENDKNPELKPSKAIMACIRAGVPTDHITVSSDGNGSIPKYDSDGKVIGMRVASVDTLLSLFRNLVRIEGVEIDEALPFLTSNVAKALDIYPRKGKLDVGSDADLLVMDRDLRLEAVFAKGTKMMDCGQVLCKGNFE